MSIGDIIVILILAVVIIACLIHMHKAAKNGGCGDCSACGGSCGGSCSTPKSKKKD